MALGLCGIPVKEAHGFWNLSRNNFMGLLVPLLFCFFFFFDRKNRNGSQLSTADKSGGRDFKNGLDFTKEWRLKERQKERTAETNCTKATNQNKPLSKNIFHNKVFVRPMRASGAHI